MLDRRTFIAAVCTGCLARSGTAWAGAWYENLVNWLVDISKRALPTVEEIQDWLLRVRRSYTLLRNSQEVLRDVQRKLTDPSRQQGLRSKLTAWLARYEAFAHEARQPGESDIDFEARKQRELTVLRQEWDVCKKDASDALQEIGRLTVELETVDTQTVPREQWQAYRHLLQDEKDADAFLTADMPADPYVLDRLREVANNFNGVITAINERAKELDAAVKRAG